jgi:hypothetical protein
MTKIQKGRGSVGNKKKPAKVAGKSAAAPAAAKKWGPEYGRCVDRWARIRNPYFPRPSMEDLTPILSSTENRVKLLRERRDRLEDGLHKARVTYATKKNPYNFFVCSWCNAYIDHFEHALVDCLDELHEDNKVKCTVENKSTARRCSQRLQRRRLDADSKLRDEALIRARQIRARWKEMTEAYDDMTAKTKKEALARRKRRSSWIAPFWAKYMSTRRATPDHEPLRTLAHLRRDFLTS